MLLCPPAQILLRHLVRKLNITLEAVRMRHARSRLTHAPRLMVSVGAWTNERARSLRRRAKSRPSRTCKAEAQPHESASLNTTYERLQMVIANSYEFRSPVCNQCSTIPPEPPKPPQLRQQERFERTSSGGTLEQQGLQSRSPPWRSRGDHNLQQIREASAEGSRASFDPEFADG